MQKGVGTPVKRLGNRGKCRKAAESDESSDSGRFLPFYHFLTLWRTFNGGELVFGLGPEQKLTSTNSETGASRVTDLTQSGILSVITLVLRTKSSKLIKVVILVLFRVDQQ